MLRTAHGKRDSLVIDVKRKTAIKYAIQLDTYLPIPCVRLVSRELQNAKTPCNHQIILHIFLLFMPFFFPALPSFYSTCLIAIKKHNILKIKQKFFYFIVDEFEKGFSSLAPLHSLKASSCFCTIVENKKKLLLMFT